MVPVKTHGIFLVNTQIERFKINKSHLIVHSLKDILLNAIILFENCLYFLIWIVFDVLRDTHAYTHTHTYTPQQLDMEESLK